MVPVTMVVVTQDERQRAYDLMNDGFKYGKLAHGDLTAQFEREFGSRVGCGEKDPNRMHAVATNSGTTALEALYNLANVVDRTVLVPTNTFSATAMAAVAAGAKHIELVDSAPGSMVPGLEQYQRAFERAVRRQKPMVAAAAWVHIGGHIDPRIEGVKDYLDGKGIVLVEDAAHAHGSYLSGPGMTGPKYPGSWGVGAAYSFYPTKVITCGEGGMVVVRKGHDADFVRMQRNHGKAASGAQQIFGWNWRISEANAAFGIVQSENLESIRRERDLIYRRYRDALADHPVVRVLEPDPLCTTAHYKVVLVPREGKIVRRRAVKADMLARHEVNAAGGVYDAPLHKINPFAMFGFDCMTNAENFADDHICLPIFRQMSDRQVDAVVTAVLDCIR